MSEHFADPDDFGELLSTSDVAKILGVNLNTAQKYVREGKIPSHRLNRGRGSKYYVFKTELLEHLRSQPRDPDTSVDSSEESRRA